MSKLSRRTSNFVFTHDKPSQQIILTYVRDPRGGKIETLELPKKRCARSDFVFLELFFRNKKRYLGEMGFPMISLAGAAVLFASDLLLVIDAISNPTSSPSGEPTAEPTGSPTPISAMPTPQPTLITQGLYYNNVTKRTIFEDYRVWVFFGIFMGSVLFIVPFFLGIYFLRAEKYERAINQYFQDKKEEIRREQDGHLDLQEYQHITMKESFQRTYGRDIADLESKGSEDSVFMSPRAPKPPAEDSDIPDPRTRVAFMNSNSRLIAASPGGQGSPGKADAKKKSMWRPQRPSPGKGLGGSGGGGSPNGGSPGAKPRSLKDALSARGGAGESPKNVRARLFGAIDVTQGAPERSSETDAGDDYLQTVSAQQQQRAVTRDQVASPQSKMAQRKANKR